MKYQLTYEDALKICAAHKNFNFYPTEYIMDGYKIVTFNYFLCEYQWFVKPLEDSDIITGYDMRGVTFVFNLDGTLYKRFLMLEKFFNLDQVEESQYHLVKDKKILEVTVKEDGSLIAFMHLPNGKVFAKTQGGFDNDQSIAANKIYANSPKLQTYIRYCLSMDRTPLFEYVSYDNRIVLQYSNPELRFIGVRYNNTGFYISASELSELITITGNDFEFLYVKAVKNVTLDELINRSKYTENEEGWVVKFEDGQMVKVKTDWYCLRHNIRTVNIFREDFVINAYFEDQLDDVLTKLDPTTDTDAFTFVKKCKDAIMNYSEHIDERVEELVKVYKDKYEGNWTKFATEQHKVEFFGLVKNKIEKPEDYYSYKIGYIQFRTRRLNMAKHIVEKWKI